VQKRVCLQQNVRFPSNKSAWNAGDTPGAMGSIPGLGRFPGKGNGNPFQCSCLENPRDGGTWWAAIHGVAQSRTRLSDFFHFSLSCTGEGNGNPLQCSCLENPRDGGAWWAAIYGVTQSRTQLKRLSSNPCTSSISITWKLVRNTYLFTSPTANSDMRSSVRTPNLESSAGQLVCVNLLLS